jgi:hypothetical protein
VQNLAETRSIFPTAPVVGPPEASRLLGERGLEAVPQHCTLRGISETFKVYEIP